MKNLSRAIAAALTIIPMSLAGCGTDTTTMTRASTVAKVGNSTISKATLDHWTAIEAVTDFNTTPQSPVPSGVIPDPPRFVRCAQWLRTAANTVADITSTAKNTELKAICASKYAALRAHVLMVLISFKWFAEESAAQGIKVSDTEVHNAFTNYISDVFSKPIEYTRFLKYTGQTLADEWLRERMDLYSTKLNEHFKANGQYRWFAFGFPKKWAAKTTCAPEYIVQNCKESTAEPEARI